MRECGVRAGGGRAGDICKGTRDVRVEDVRRVVHARLEGAVEVGEGLGAAREAEAGAEVVAAAETVHAGAAHDAGLDRDALAHGEVGDALAHGSDDACSLVTEYEGLAQRKVAVAAVLVVVHWGGQRGCQGRREARRRGAHSLSHRDPWREQLLGPRQPAGARWCVARCGDRWHRGGRRREREGGQQALWMLGEGGGGIDEARAKELGRWNI